MNVTDFGLLLAVSSTLTGLATEAVKGVLDEKGYTYASNTLAGLVAAAVAVLTGVLYCLVSGSGSVMMVILLILLSWLCAMVGYDKVIQTLKQIGGTEDE